jgi:hypothetical protein
MSGGWAIGAGPTSMGGQVRGAGRPERTHRRGACVVVPPPALWSYVIVDFRDQSNLNLLHFAGSCPIIESEVPCRSCRHPGRPAVPQEEGVRWRESRPRLGKESAMIGLIRFDLQGGSAEAILGDDGRWSRAVVPCLVRPLDIRYGPNWEGLPAGRRHLEEAAHWLNGVVAFGGDAPVPGVSPPSDPGASAGVFDRPCHHPTAHVKSRSDRLTDCAAARLCGVGTGMIGLWVKTGAWPMPLRREAASATFELSDVEGWLATGDWPAGAHFHARPEFGAPPALPGWKSGQRPLRSGPAGSPRF